MIKFQIPIIIIALLSVAGCEKKNTYRDTPTDSCQNLTLAVKGLHPGDRVYVYYDTRLLLRQKVDSLSGAHFHKEFCNRYRREGVLGTVILEKKRVLIDTALQVKKPVTGYQVSADRFLGRVILEPTPSR
ncbi:hypothetical protein [Mucilaginibacter ginsenosidivorans]|jgi:hypothetical protein|uniref:Lipoprotein n=1 Tax=Mucilaginibacter ginsenosidivorans TaxID=398053 RepID=A0A5B8UUE1_9SPHI|nr:hypothetical protein [Mucilaginibacter ginsenosidivorans]QEC62385.1 hypothetical protein FRZ54_07235 [Mucilaginibacter ginsenosidivorans]